MISDVFPALALGLGKGDYAVMNYPPRGSQEPILTQRHWLAIGGYGMLIAGAVLSAFTLAFFWLGVNQDKAVTISFLTLAFARTWHTFNMRDPGSRFLHNEVTRNPFVWGAVALCIVLLLGAVYIPSLALVLSLQHPSYEGWLLIGGMSFIPFVVLQIWKSIRLDGQG